MGYKTYICPVERDCGGCELLSVPYPKQLERKSAYIQDLFSEFECEYEGVKGMADPRFYRTKIMTPFVAGSYGRVLHGMYARGTHKVIEPEDCLVEDPIGQPIIRTIAALAEEAGIEPYDENTGRGILRHAVIRVGANTGQVMVILVVNRKEFPHKKWFVRELRAEFSEISTVVFNVNTRQTNAVLGPLAMTAYGQGWIEDKLCGCTFRIPALAFFQTNVPQTEILYETALDYARIKPDELVVDTYCGIGTIGIIAAKRAKCKVLGIETVPAAVEAAQENAALNKLRKTKFVAGDAGEVLEQRVEEGKLSPDVVILDPPRSGSTPQFLESVKRADPRCIVYVSCNPETQVRDIKLLQDRYHVRRLAGVDMFPHTKHVETVACLLRNA